MTWLIVPTPPRETATRSWNRTPTPSAAVSTAQRRPAPGAGPHAQVWSPIALALLTRRLTVALRAPAPPARKNTSCSEVGLVAWLAEAPAGPTSISTGELVAP